MGDISQERPNEGPILSFNKKLYRLSLNKRFDTHVENSIVFKELEK